MKLFIKITLLLKENYKILKNKTIPLINNDTASLYNKKKKNNQQNMSVSKIKSEQLINVYPWQQQSEKNNAGNKYFSSKATIDKKTTLSVTTNSSYKKRNLITKKDDLFKHNNNVRKKGKINLQLRESNSTVAINKVQSDKEDINNDDLRKRENQLFFKNEKIEKSKEEWKDSIRQEVNVPLKINKKDSVNTATVNKIKKTSSSLKNKFFKNIGCSVFTSPEVNTVKFKGSDKVTVGYGAGINYTIGKHFTLQAQFAKIRKVYVTDRKGYNPAAGSSLIPVDTLKVNADCKVWDIPVNLRYSFAGNIKSSFFISAGISSYILTKKRNIENENKHSFCNLNLTVGYQYWLNKKWSIGFEPYLKLPLNGIGAGKVKLTSAGALFNLTFKPF